MVRGSELLVCVVLGMLATSCGGGSSSTPAAPTGAGATISAFSPSSLQTSSSPQTITVTGSGFSGSMSVNLSPPSAATLTATIVSATQFQLTGTFTSPGTYTLSVTMNGVTTSSTFSVTGSSIGTGGSGSFSVSPNPLTLAGQVTDRCPVNGNYGSATGTFTVTASAGVTWTASLAWTNNGGGLGGAPGLISSISPTSGTGSGTVTVTVVGSPNPSQNCLNGTITYANVVGFRPSAGTPVDVSVNIPGRD